MTPRLVRIRLTVASCAIVSALFAQNPPASPTPLPSIPRQNPPGTNQPAAAQPVPNQPVTAQPIPPRPAVPSVAPAGNPDEEVRLVLPDADIDTVLSALEIYTGRIILRPAQLPTATYNLKIKNPIPKSEAIVAIETVLALNGIGIAPLGERFLKVLTKQGVKVEAPEMISGSAFDQPASGKIASKLFQLEFLRVPEVFQMIQPLLDPYFGGPVQLLNANSLLVTDSISNLQRVELLLQQVDRPVSAGMKPKFYAIHNSKASDLVNKLRTILTPLAAQLGSATTYNADDRTNQIVLLTDPRQYAFFDELIERLDQRSDPNTRTEVLYLKHAKAEDVVTVLSKIISGQTTALQRQNQGGVRPGTLPTPNMPNQPAQPTPATPTTVSGSAAANPNLDALGASSEFSALMTVVNDTRSNAVVVFGTGDDIRLVKDLVDKLDIVLAQVRIEVVIAEVTVSDNDQTGISALGLKLDGDKLVGFSGGLSGDSMVVSNGTVTRPGTSGHMDLAMEIAIGTTPRKSNNTILSHPAIVTSHGKKAKIFSGETRPVVTGTVSAAGAINNGLATSSSITQQSIGTTLTVTPFIGVDGSVNLDITQSVEDVVDTVIVDSNQQYVIGKRETESNISAKSGDILVFGGYQKQIDTKGTSRLGPIPIIGDLFGSRTKNKSHQELIFFMRPTVLTNDPQTDNAETMQRLEKLPTRDQIKSHLDPTFEAPKKSILDQILPK